MSTTDRPVAGVDKPGHRALPPRAYARPAFTAGLLAILLAGAILSVEGVLTLPGGVSSHVPGPAPSTGDNGFTAADMAAVAALPAVAPAVDTALPEVTPSPQIVVGGGPDAQVVGAPLVARPRPTAFVPSPPLQPTPAPVQPAPMAPPGRNRFGTGHVPRGRGQFPPGHR